MLAAEPVNTHNNIILQLLPSHSSECRLLKSLSFDGIHTAFRPVHVYDTMDYINVCSKANE